MRRPSSDDNLEDIDWWTDNGYSTNSSNNPYRFDHLHKSESSVEQEESAENLKNN